MALNPSMIVEPNDVRAAAVAVVDTAGNQLGGFDPSRPATAVISSVPASSTSVVLLPANPARRRVVITNTGSKTLSVAFAATATTALFTVQIASGNVYEGPLDDYTGVISGIWPNTSGAAVVTEITT